MPLSYQDPSRPRPFELFGALLFALLVHLVLLILFALWSEPSTAAEEPREPQILVSLEPVPEPDPSVAQPLPVVPAEPEKPPVEEIEQEPEEEAETPPPQEDESLLGWTTRGDEPGEAVRPPGPEATVPGTPAREEAEEIPPEEAVQGEIRDGPEALPEPDEPDEEIPLRTPQDSEPSQPDEPAEEPFTPRPLSEEDLGRDADSGDEGGEELPEGPQGLRSGPTGAPGDLAEPRTLPSSPEQAPPRQPPSAREPASRPLDPTDFQVGGAFGDIQFESRDYHWSEYSTKVYFAVYRTWLEELWQASRRRAFSRDQSLTQLEHLVGDVVIRFVIDRQGNVGDLEVQLPSVLPTLDQASQAALERAILPPLPSDFPRDREGVTFSFHLRVPDEASLKQSLYWAKQAGAF